MSDDSFGQKMSTDDSARLLFRLKHIIPRSISISALRDMKDRMTVIIPQTVDDASLTHTPEEFEFQMTWGKVAVKIWGPPDGRPVLAMPGWLDNAGTFDTLIPLLPKDLRIVVVDTPGHGWSDPFPPDIAYNSLDGLVAIERMTKHFKWNKFSLMGHSVGGVLAMLYSGIFPEKVEKLVTLDVVRGIPTIPEKVDRRLRNIVEKLLQYEEDIIAGPEKPISYETAIRRSVRGTLGSLDEKASEIMFKRGLKQVEGGYALTRDRRMLTAPLIFWPKEDQLVLARKVTADVLIIKFLDGPYFESEEDYLEHVEALKTKSKNVQYVEVEGQHHAHLTHPERIAPIISKFFSLANNS